MNKRDIKRNCKELVEFYKDEILNPTGFDNLFYDEFYSEDITYNIYIGSVLSLTPSGKYYLPFACSHVENCNRCKGKGCEYCGYIGSREAYEDELFYEYIESYLNPYNAYITSGEGNPLDLYISFPIDFKDLNHTQKEYIKSEFDYKI